MPVQAPSLFTGWINDRRSYIQSELAKRACGFAITNNGGLNFTTSASGLVLAGKAPPKVKSLALNSVLTNVVWFTETNWNLTVSLNNGPNAFTMQAYDRFTNSITGSNSTITITREP